MLRSQNHVVSFTDWMGFIEVEGPFVLAFYKSSLLEVLSSISTTAMMKVLISLLFVFSCMYSGDCYKVPRSEEPDKYYARLVSYDTKPRAKGKPEAGKSNPAFKDSNMAPALESEEFKKGQMSVGLQGGVEGNPPLKSNCQHVFDPLHDLTGLPKYCCNGGVIRFDFHSLSFHCRCPIGFKGKYCGTAVSDDVDDLITRDIEASKSWEDEEMGGKVGRGWKPLVHTKEHNGGMSLCDRGSALICVNDGVCVIRHFVQEVKQICVCRPGYMGRHCELFLFDESTDEE